MTPGRFKEIREQLGLNQTELAPLIGHRTSNKISGWETGRIPIPWAVSEIMDLRAKLRPWQLHSRINERLLEFMRDHRSDFCEQAQVEFGEIVGWISRGAQ